MWIGISGPIAAGKTTLAKALVDRCKRPAVVVSFSSGLKLLVNTLVDNKSKDKNDLIKYVYLFLNQYAKDVNTIHLLNVAIHIVETVQEHNFTLRQLYQYIGTDIVRNTVDKNFWINYIRLNYDHSLVWITDDVRFNNEAAVLNFHIGIDVTSFYDEYMRRLNVQTLLKGEGFINHESERSLSLSPNLIIPISYDLLDVCRQLNKHYPNLFYE